MFLRAGALSLVLLLASRLLGLAREGVQAAAFGVGGLADAAVLMLTLPDWLAGVLASGALAYVMLPTWSGQDVAAVAHTQRRLAAVLLAGGVILGLLLMLFRAPVLRALAPGIEPALRESAQNALLWSAAAVPLALLAALWTTRLQYEREYLGMYSANLVVNIVLITGLASAAVVAAVPQRAVALLGGALLVAMVARLAWLRARHQLAVSVPEAAIAPASMVNARLPAPTVWLWAILASGLPLALPFAARSIASTQGEGALAIFNYAWKLVELPLMLAVQLVATLAFSPIAVSLSRPGVAEDDIVVSTAIRSAFALAWTLACAAAAVLLWAAPVFAKLLFGWGRMDYSSLVLVAQWGRVAAWGLLPQALIAVALVVLASRRGMHAVVLAYAVALAALLLAAALGLRDGGALMRMLNILLAWVAVVALFALGPARRAWLPCRSFSAAGAALLLCQGVAAFGGHLAFNMKLELAAGAVAALLVLLAAWFASPDLRRALRR